MTDADNSVCVGLVQALAAVFRVDPTEALLTGYWLGLSDLPLPVVSAGVQRALRECQFMPSVAELRKLAGHGKREITPPYLKRWRDPLALPAMHPRDTWPKEEK